MWQLWMLGNRHLQVTALRLLCGSDLKHLDAATAREEGKTTQKVRRAVKGFCELKYLMKFIEERVRERGAFHGNPSVEQVIEMY